MPDFGTWMGWHSTGDFEEWYRQADRGDSIAFIIGHRGVSLTLWRAGTAQAAQTCLLVPAGRNNEATEVTGGSGTAAKEQLLIVGLTTMNIQRGDQFKYPSTLARLNYEVIRVEKALGSMIQAFAEEVQ